MGIPASNTLTLVLNNTTGIITVTTGSEGTAFRIDQGSGLQIPAPASLEGLALTAGTLALSFTAAFSGQVAVAITVGPGSFLLVGGNFTPGSVQAAWVGQSGGYEPVSAGAKLPID